MAPRTSPCALSNGRTLPKCQTQQLHGEGEKTRHFGLPTLRQNWPVKHDGQKRIGPNWTGQSRSLPGEGGGEVRERRSPGEKPNLEHTPHTTHNTTFLAQAISLKFLFFVNGRRGRTGTRKGWKFEEDTSRSVWKRIPMGPRS